MTDVKDLDGKDAIVFAIRKGVSTEAIGLLTTLMVLDDHTRAHQTTATLSKMTGMSLVRTGKRLTELKTIGLVWQRPYREDGRIAGYFMHSPIIAENLDETRSVEKVHAKG
jgi:hypothetical protein